MKTYKNLWPEFISDENIKLAIKEAAKHPRKSKRKRELFTKMKNNPDKYIGAIRYRANHFYNSPHSPILIADGTTRKIRTIIVPDVTEQIIHHMIIQVLNPMMMKGMYEHSYASIPYRGAHKAKKVIEKWIRKDGKNVKYCLKMDIRKFFDSIDHDVLINKLGTKIKDEKMLELIRVLLTATKQGIPLGFYTSQWFANWLLQDLDHYIKEKLGAAHYVRYLDDMVIFGSNKKKLHKIRKAIAAYLGTLKLELKSNWQVYRFDYVKEGRHYGRDLDFMGFRFYREKTILRRSIMLRCTRKARKLHKKKVTVYDARQFLSYMGWISSTDSKKMFKEWIKPYVTVRLLRKTVAKYDKRRNKLCSGEKVSQPLSRSS